MTVHERRTCGAAEELEPVISRSLADGTERTEWFCTDAAACNDRRFPELAGFAAQAEAEAGRGRTRARQLGRNTP